MKKFERDPESCHLVGQLTAKPYCEFSAALHAIQEPHFGKGSSSPWYHLSGVEIALRDIARMVPPLKAQARVLEKKMNAAKKSIYKTSKAQEASTRLYPLLGEVAELREAGKGLCASRKV
jgi:hypothetical protein